MGTEPEWELGRDGKGRGLGANNGLREGKQGHGDWLWQVKLLLWEVVQGCSEMGD